MRISSKIGTMKYKLKVQRTFEREAKRLGKRYPSLKSDVIALSGDILSNPQLGTDLGRGLRKIRMAITSKGRGKSGGARVITFTVVVDRNAARKERADGIKCSEPIVFLPIIRVEAEALGCGKDNNCEKIGNIIVF